MYFDIKSKKDIDDLINRIDQIIISDYKEHTILIDYKSLKSIDYIYKNSIVINRRDKYDFIEMKISCNDISYNKIIKKIGLK